MQGVWLWKLWNNIQQDRKAEPLIPGGPVPTLIFAHSLEKDKISYQHYYYFSEVLLYNLIHHLQKNGLLVSVSLDSFKQYNPLLEA